MAPQIPQNVYSILYPKDTSNSYRQLWWPLEWAPSFQKEEDGEARSSPRAQDEKDLSWEDFRGKVLGPTDPAQAPQD